jgi:hypothetical protein
LVGAAGRGLVGAGGEVFATQKIPQYIKKMATDRGGGGAGGLMVTIATAKFLVPGSIFLQKWKRKLVSVVENGNGNRFPFPLPPRKSLSVIIYGFHEENGNRNWFPLRKMETDTSFRFVHFPRVRVCLWSIVKKIIPPKKCG